MRVKHRGTWRMLCLLWSWIESDKRKCWVGHLVVPDSLQPQGLWPARLLCLVDFPGKNAGVGSHALLQGTLPTKGSNPGLLHSSQILYHPSHQISYYIWTTLLTFSVPVILTCFPFLLTISGQLHKLFLKYFLIPSNSTHPFRCPLNITSFRKPAMTYPGWIRRLFSVFPWHSITTLDTLCSSFTHVTPLALKVCREVQGMYLFRTLNKNPWEYLLNE